MSQTSGQLAAGQSVTFVVQVQRIDGAVGSATISINSAAVPVTWEATQPNRHRRPQPGQPAAPGPASSRAASGGRPLRELATGGGRSQ